MAQQTQKPSQINDIEDARDWVTSTLDDLSSQKSPTQILTRQGVVPSWRRGKTNRQVMKWLAPNQPMIEMYINPKSLKISYGKTLGGPTRTKGGYVIQYWGENLINLALSGTTGTSGIEGVNILRDIYRSEQLSLDPYALFLQSVYRVESQNSVDSMFGLSSLTDSISLLSGAKQNSLNPYNFPTLASLAFTVELYWAGEVYRGFFKDFSYDENAERPGLFDYSLSFTATQKRGFRSNFMPWHKSPTEGGSVAPKYRPHSFGSLQENDGVIVQVPNFGNVNTPINYVFQDINTQTTTNKNTINQMAGTTIIDAFSIINIP